MTKMELIEKFVNVTINNFNSLEDVLDDDLELAREMMLEFCTELIRIGSIK